jgi:hypothetical protein
MIYDLDDNPISSFSMSVGSGDDSVLQLKADCVAGYELRSDEVAGITVDARRQGDASWIAIETTPIDLSQWAGSRQIFEVRLTASSVAAVMRRRLGIRVVKS